MCVFGIFLEAKREKWRKHPFFFFLFAKTPPPDTSCFPKFSVRAKGEIKIPPAWRNSRFNIACFPTSQKRIDKNRQTCYFVRIFIGPHSLTDGRKHSFFCTIAVIISASAPDPNFGSGEARNRRIFLKIWVSLRPKISMEVPQPSPHLLVSFSRFLNGGGGGEKGPFFTNSWQGHSNSRFPPSLGYNSKREIECPHKSAPSIRGKPMPQLVAHGFVILRRRRCLCAPPTSVSQIRNGAVKADSTCFNATDRSPPLFPNAPCSFLNEFFF